MTKAPHTESGQTQYISASSTKMRCVQEAVLVLVLAILCTAYFTYPLVRYLDSRLFELNDSKLTVYIQAWVTHALMTPTVHVANMNMYYPATHTLAGSENLFGLQFFFAPVYLISHNPVLASNVVILTSFSLCFLTMYLFLRLLIGNPWAATLGAFIYGFPVCRVAQMQTGHMQLLSMQWVPLIVLFLYSFMAKQRRRSLVLMGICVVLQVLCSVYLGYMALIILVCYGLGVLATRFQLITMFVARDLAVSLLICAAILVPVLIPYLKIAQQSNLNQDEVMAVTTQAAANPLGSYLDVTGFPHNVYARILQKYGSKELGWEKRLFIGFCPMLLCLFALLGAAKPLYRGLRSSSSSELASMQFPCFVGSVLTIVVTYTLSLGPYLRIHDQATRLRLPLFWLRRWVPGLAMFRVPARFALAMNFGVAVLAAFGFMFLLRAAERRLKNKNAARIGLTTVACLILATEFGLSPLQLQPVMTVHNVSPEYKWLSTLPSGSVTLELPITFRAPNFPDPYEQVQYVYASVYHWQPLINGSTGYPPKVSYLTYRLASQLPSRAAADALQKLGLRYLLVHTDTLGETEWKKWRDEAEATGLSEIRQFDDGCVAYQLGSMSVPRF